MSLNDLLVRECARIDQKITEEFDYARARRDVNDYYQGRRLDNKCAWRVRWPSTDGQSITWHEAIFDGRFNANTFVRNHGIQGAIFAPVL